MDIGTRSLMERSRDPSVAGGSRLRCAGTRQKEPSASIPRRPPKLPHLWPPKLLHLAGVS